MSLFNFDSIITVLWQYCCLVKTKSKFQQVRGTSQLSSLALNKCKLLVNNSKLLQYWSSTLRTLVEIK